MHNLSLSLLAETVATHRKSNNLTQTQLSQLTGINRSILSRLESADYMPSVNQLQALSEVLDFNPADLFVPADDQAPAISKPYNIAVAGTGYVGLSLAVLLAQHNNVTAVDLIPEKVDKLNKYISPIQDEYIEKYLADAKAGERELNLTATTNGDEAYKNIWYLLSMSINYLLSKRLDYHFTKSFARTHDIYRVNSFVCRDKNKLLTVVSHCSKSCVIGSHHIIFDSLASLRIICPAAPAPINIT